jgi:hypothetical protein
MEMLNNVELVMFSTFKKEKGEEALPPPLVAEMRAALQANGFDPARAEDIPYSSAFRRAVEDAKKGIETENKLKVTCVEGEEGTVYGQIDELAADPETRRINRTRVAGWILTASTNEAKAKVYNVETTEGGEPLDMVTHTTTYAWADLTAIAREIMKTDCMGSYSPKSNGGVYFVPVPDREFLDRLQAAFAACNFNVLRFGVPDSAAERAHVSSTVAEQIAADLAEHEAAIAAYTPETKAGHITNRRDAVTASAEMLTRISGTLYLGEAKDRLTARIQAIYASIEEKLSAATEAKAAAAPAGQPGQRRILTASA